MQLSYPHSFPARPRYSFQVRIAGRRTDSLVYRGTRYTPTQPTLEAVEASYQVMFLGQPATVKRYIVDRAPQAPVTMTYRGVRYSR